MFTLSDAVTAAIHERRHWLCHTRNGDAVLWVLVALGALAEFDGAGWRPFTPTAEQLASDGWQVSKKGPSAAGRRK